jgi:hypothetical protein
MARIDDLRVKAEAQAVRRRRRAAKRVPRRRYRKAAPPSAELLTRERVLLKGGPLAWTATLEIQYTGDPGNPLVFDREIAAAVGRTSDDSGSWLARVPVRDLSWRFDTNQQAQAAGKRVLRLGLPSVRVSIREEPADRCVTVVGGSDLRKKNRVAAKRAARRKVRR